MQLRNVPPFSARNLTGPLTLADLTRDELDFLRQLAAELADNNPDLAGVLAQGANDALVERLIQGAAIINAVRKRKRDDAFPELTRTCLSRVFPFPPIPALGMVQALPQKSAETYAVRLLAGTELATEQGFHCMTERSCILPDVRFGDKLWKLPQMPGQRPAL
ncbi:MAG: type VI secretion system baseplate subunit TssF [Enterobacteriaceae bacterium]